MGPYNTQRLLCAAMSDKRAVHWTELHIKSHDSKRRQCYGQSPLQTYSVSNSYNLHLFSVDFQIFSIDFQMRKPKTKTIGYYSYELCDNFKSCDDSPSKKSFPPPPVEHEIYGKFAKIGKSAHILIFYFGNGQQQLQRNQMHSIQQLQYPPIVQLISFYLKART